MQFEIENHLLSNVQYVPSPNQSDRPPGTDIDLLVIHNISLPPGEFGTDCVEQLFCNTLDCSTHPFFESLVDLKVSSHLLIDRLGTVTQFVPFHRKAWHAGESQYEDRSNCNDFSIGIEMEGTDEEAFTDEQYSQLASVSRTIIEAYPALTREHIVGHSDIAPGRKTDPGPHFDWQRYKGMI